MYSMLYWLYFTLGYYSRRYRNPFLTFLFHGSSYLCREYFHQVMIRLYRRRKRVGVTKKKRGQRIIASLTTYPARIETVWIAVESILSQSVLADEVLLWLATSQFPDGVESLPKELQAQTKRGLTICFCEDLYSHKKYYYTLKEYPKDILITFDDDMFYPKNTIKTLLKLHVKEPNSIICSSSSTFHQGNFLNPILWEPNMHERVAAYNLGINSGSGTLFPPGALHENVFDHNNMQKLALQTDDLWLTAAAYMKGTSFVSLRYRPFPVLIQGSQAESLYSKNNFQASVINNNTQWLAILRHYRSDLREWLLLYGIKDDSDLS